MPSGVFQASLPIWDACVLFARPDSSPRQAGTERAQLGDSRLSPRSIVTSVMAKTQSFTLRQPTVYLCNAIPQILVFLANNFGCQSQDEKLHHRDTEPHGDKLCSNRGEGITILNLQAHIFLRLFSVSLCVSVVKPSSIAAPHLVSAPISTPARLCPEASETAHGAPFDTKTPWKRYRPGGEGTGLLTASQYPG